MITEQQVIAAHALWNNFLLPFDALAQKCKRERALEMFALYNAYRQLQGRA